MEIGSETFGEFGSDLARILLHEALFQPDVAQAQGSQRRCARRRQASESDQRPIAPLQDGGGRHGGEQSAHLVDGGWIALSGGSRDGLVLVGQVEIIGIRESNFGTIAGLLRQPEEEGAQVAQDRKNCRLAQALAGAAVDSLG